jgi:hypothetical protein
MTKSEDKQVSLWVTLKRLTPLQLLPVNSFAFLAIDITVALGPQAGSRRIALRLARETAVAAAFKLHAVIDSGTTRRGRCGLDPW